MSSLKKELRKKIKSKFSESTQNELDKKSELLSKNLKELLQKILKNSDIVIGVFFPLGDEPKWELEDFEDRVAFPCVIDEQMEFVKCRPSDCVESKDFGVSIKGPSKSHKEIAKDLGALIIPGVAFDKEGNRLGRGKGHYDKYLENYRGLRIGVCFSFQVCQQVPTESHDQKMNYLVTDNEVFYIRELT